MIDPESKYWNDIIEKAAWRTWTEPLDITKLGVVNANGSDVFYYDGRYGMRCIRHAHLHYASSVQ